MKYENLEQVNKISAQIKSAIDRKKTYTDYLESGFTMDLKPRRNRHDSMETFLNYNPYGEQEDLEKVQQDTRLMNFIEGEIDALEAELKKLHKELETL